MSLRDITRENVEKALRKFDRIGRDVMLAMYGGRPSARWYIEHEEKDYDQRLVIRAAHSLQGLGSLGKFTPYQARRHLTKLGFRVIRWTLYGDLPEPLLNGIIEHLGRNHTAGFYLAEKGNERILGSGVLVSAGGIYAILTAHHVIECIKKPREQKRLGLLFAERSDSHAIDPWAIKLIKIARGEKDSDGPDLGAVVFAPQAPILGSIKANKVFYNLDKRRERMLDEPPRLRDGIWAVQGFVEKLTNVETVPGGGIVRVRFHAATAFSRHETEENGEYDYLDFPADPSDLRPTSIPPDSWGGMSGGGLWQIPLNQKRKNVERESPLLSGIMFWQGKADQRVQWIKCHGRRSVYEHALEAIRESKF